MPDKQAVKREAEISAWWAAKQEAAEATEKMKQQTDKMLRTMRQMTTLTVDSMVKSHRSNSMTRREIREEIIERSNRIAARKIAKAVAREGEILTRWYEYPDIPGWTVVATSGSLSKVPKTSGIYFVWDAVRCAYVGKSVNLRDRVNLSHKQINSSDLVSWVCLDVEEEKDLLYAESFYIGILAPHRNFGNGGT
jgi:hypothetical protein